MRTGEIREYMYSLVLLFTAVAERCDK
jgi:hypothetical protein